jgi:hypothetical protein
MSVSMPCIYFLALPMLSSAYKVPRTWAWRSELDILSPTPPNRSHRQVKPLSSMYINPFYLRYNIVPLETTTAEPSPKRTHPPSHPVSASRHSQDTARYAFWVPGAFKS